ncbi:MULTISPECIES: DUF6544 family protein [unclassified Arenibacter]|uniref:DUF6544 family protein n=1 Tax=unclassified Arenibacter TaxID=2615047 RepID=UPI000E34783D|nr:MULTISPECIES: DUF6544 family protein [unclassified Arenibacter]MCM4164501.1 hypothetical protein [Arenibacter sp. A80]RFT55589.1 hypothetical protein D0S24_12925 [Arenibacter sp. P308M17]
MRIGLVLFMVLHGLIHFMGFAKAFQFGEMAQFTKEISKPLGILWFIAVLLFLGTAILVLLKKELWPILGIATVVFSQILIITVWTDARYGTIANIIILGAAIVGQANLTFERSYKDDVASAMNTVVPNPVLLCEEDLEPLPECIKNYLRYTGAVGKPKIYNMKITLEGEMRERGKDWFKFTSEQHNFFDCPTRMFLMKARVNGLPTMGYHKYNREGARMNIRLLSLFSIVDINGSELYPTETVTYFNELCLFAPAALIDERISWEVIDNLCAKATFDNKGTVVSAVLYFNEKGQLINFVSNDRYSVSEMQAFPFSTPVSNYKNVNGYKRPFYGEAIWQYPEGEFVYGKFCVKDVVYNIMNPNVFGDETQ